MVENDPHEEVISLLDLEDAPIDVVDLIEDSEEAFSPPAQATPDILAQHRVDMKRLLSKRFGRDYNLTCLSGKSGEPGGKLYERFRKAHDTVCKTTKTKGKKNSGDHIELVFHGTPLKNM